MLKNNKGEDLVFIKETIVVEGRDDTNAINRAVRGTTIETHGFGISQDTWKKLDAANNATGLIIFTDPDFAGNEIRRRVKERYPKAKEAFLSKSKAEKKGDIGVENASPEDIREALTKAKATVNQEGMTPIFTLKDLDEAGLVGREDSRWRREKIGDNLGIGYANVKGLLKKLNTMGITRDAFDRAVKEIDSY